MRFSVLQRCGASYTIGDKTAQQCGALMAHVGCGMPAHPNLDPVLRLAPPAGSLLDGGHGGNLGENVPEVSQTRKLPSGRYN